MHGVPRYCQDVRGQSKHTLCWFLVTVTERSAVHFSCVSWERQMTTCHVSYTESLPIFNMDFVAFSFSSIRVKTELLNESRLPLKSVGSFQKEESSHPKTSFPWRKMGWMTLWVVKVSLVASQRWLGGGCITWNEFQFWSAVKATWHT